MRCGWGRPVLAALVLWSGPVLARDVLRIEGPAGLIAERDAPPGAEWCLSWNHSVTGGGVADCFVNDAGQMVLDRSYLHDFAAGLGTVAGRGTLTSAAGGGYWIVGMGDAIAGNALVLRVGRAAVDHHLWIGTSDIALSVLVPGQRVTLRLVSTP